MPPQAGRLMGNAVHVERVEAIGPAHWQNCRRNDDRDHRFLSTRFKVGVSGATIACGPGDA
jgi:hypothetical protein